MLVYQYLGVMSLLHMFVMAEAQVDVGATLAVFHCGTLPTKLFEAYHVVSGFQDTPLQQHGRHTASCNCN